jgi:DMSO/TMAO reductase YedYZ heme-binding membrane subunit
MTSLWWYIARSSGLVAWALLALSVLWGLALSTRALGARPRANWLLDLHRFLGGLAVVFVAVHLVGLALDPWVQIGVTQMLVPFSSSWNPVAVAWGVVGLYLLAAVELTSLLRKHMPKRWWKGVHLSSYGLYAVATIHLLTAGTDRHSPVLLWSVLGATTAIVVFTTYRIVGPGKAVSARAGRPTRRPVAGEPTVIDPGVDARQRVEV